MIDNSKWTIIFSKLTPILRTEIRKAEKHKGYSREPVQQMIPFSQKHQRKEIGGLMRIFK
jgi:hypothetical protein